jgi:isopentenyldiphosphate isomerase
MDHLKKTLYIAHITEADTVIDQVERWEAHRKGILHRAFTISLFFEGQAILQYRKHPVFNEVFDVSISSHQIYENDTLQEDKIAIVDTLQREWNISTNDLLAPPRYKGLVKYIAKDPKSEFIEHEVCHFYSAELTNLKLPNLDMAYGFCLKKIEELKNPFDPLYPLLAPWVHEGLKHELI